MRHDRILHTDAVTYWGDVGVRTPPACTDQIMDQHKQSRVDCSKDMAQQQRMTGRGRLCCSRTWRPALCASDWRPPAQRPIVNEVLCCSAIQRRYFCTSVAILYCMRWRTGSQWRDLSTGETLWSCVLVWSHSAYTDLVNIQLNSTVYSSSPAHSTPLPWLPVLANIEQPVLRRKAAADRLVTKVHLHWYVWSTSTATDSKPLWSDLQPIDIHQPLDGKRGVSSGG